MSEKKNGYLEIKSIHRDLFENSSPWELVWYPEMKFHFKLNNRFFSTLEFLIPSNMVHKAECLGLLYTKFVLSSNSDKRPYSFLV